MSRFYGSLKGQAKSTATRRGGPSSGMQSHIRDWDCGIEIICSAKTKDVNQFEVWLTSGSNKTKPSVHLLTISHEEGSNHKNIRKESFLLYHKEKGQ